MSNLDLFDDFVEVPILWDFDPDKQIGTLKILRDSLPPEADFSFTLGYKIFDCGGYELICVSPVQDSIHLKYLQENCKNV